MLHELAAAGVAETGKGLVRGGGHLEERVGMLEEPAADGVARLVDRYALPLRLGQDLVLLLDAPDLRAVGKRWSRCGQAVFTQWS